MSGLRKSARKKPSDIAKEEQEKLEMNLAIRDDKALGLEIVQTEIGRGIAVSLPFNIYPFYYLALW